MLIYLSFLKSDPPLCTFDSSLQVGSGKQTRWLMDKILLTNLSTAAVATFLHRDWVTVDGGKVSVPKDMPKVDWKVRCESLLDKTCKTELELGASN